MNHRTFVTAVLLIGLPPLLGACGEAEPPVSLACKFIAGSEDREARDMNFVIDLASPKVDIDAGTWIYGERAASDAYGKDTISLRRHPHTGEILMTAIRADVPATLRYDPGTGMLFYAYVLADGIRSFQYACK